MKRIVFIIVFLLINGSSVFAENLTGVWYLGGEYIPAIMRQEITSQGITTVTTEPHDFDFTETFNVIQDADGKLSGRVVDGDNVYTLSGVIDEKNVSFTYTYDFLGYNLPGYFTEVHHLEGKVNSGIIVGDASAIFDLDYDAADVGWHWHASSNSTGTFAVIIGPPISVVEPANDTDRGPPQDDKRKSQGDPINIVTGNMYVVADDIVIPGRGLNCEFTRTYNSLEETAGSFGYGWTHSYNIFLVENAAAKTVKIKDGQGAGILFGLNVDSTYTPQRGEHSTLVKNVSGFTWTKKNGDTYRFNAVGKLASITDRNANAITFTYDLAGRMTKITDTVNRVINLAYDAQNRITSLTDPVGRLVSYQYDARGDLIKVIDPAGKTVSYIYDANHNLTKKTNARNYSVTFAYDGNGKCVSSTGENLNGRVDVTYNTVLKKSIVTNSRNAQETYFYNADGLITKIINSKGDETLTEWDSSFNMISHLDENEGETLFGYDSKGNLILVEDALGKESFFVYEPAFNLIKRSTDAKGAVTVYEYDVKGNLLKLTDALNNSFTYAYDAFGLPVNVTDALGRVTGFTFDIQANLAAVKDTTGNLTSYTYDGIGNAVQVKNAKNSLTQYAYDSLNQLTRVTYADNSYVVFGYDSSGNRISARDGNGFTTSYVYDSANRVKTVTDPLGNKVQYDYDTQGNLLKVYDQNLNPTTYVYDDLNRIVTRTDALGHITSVTYDAVGNVLSKTDANGQVARFEYDEMNRLSRAIYPGATVSYEYDALGLLSSFTDARGKTAFTYDKLGRLTKVLGPGSDGAVEYAYDKMGNRISMTGPDSKVIMYGYDSLNRLILVTDPQGKQTRYTYDAASNPESRVYPNGVKTQFTFDAVNRLTKLVNQKVALPQEKIAEFTYAYDQGGRRTKVDFTGGSVSYDYDNDNKLLQETRTGTTAPGIIKYAYDAAGNRLSLAKNNELHAYTYNAFNQLIRENIVSAAAKNITVTGTATDVNGLRSVTVNGLNATLAGSTYTYSGLPLVVGVNKITVTAIDKAGNPAMKSINVTYSPAVFNTTNINYTYDDNGNLLGEYSSGKSVVYAYDAQNRLSGYTAPGSTASFSYDGLGRRVSVTNGGVATQYIYDGRDVLLEKNTGGAVTARYVREPNVPGGIGGIISAQSASGPQYYQYDGQGSVAVLTDASAAVMQAYAYDAFGNSLISGGVGVNPYQYSTKALDPTGLVYFGARYYNPRIGRWITPDPMGMIDGPNLYAYVNNNPVNLVDLWGWDTYYINNIFYTSIPTDSPLSHSFMATTDRDPITGRETVMETVGWTGVLQYNNPQDMEGAQNAIDSGIGAKKYGTESLDAFAIAEYEKRMNQKGGYNPFVNNCKEALGNLLTEAIKRWNISEIQKMKDC